MQQEVDGVPGELPSASKCPELPADAAAGGGRRGWRGKVMLLQRQACTTPCCCSTSTSLPHHSTRRAFVPHPALLQAMCALLELRCLRSMGADAGAASASASAPASASSLGTATWLLCFIHLSLADIVWSLTTPATYAQYREVSTGVLRLFTLGTWQLLCQLLNNHGPPPAAAAAGLPAAPAGLGGWLIAAGHHAAHFLLLLWASGVLPLAMTSICLRQRLR